MTPNPDVRPVGWVTDQPGATLRRERSTVLLVVAILLMVAGVAGLVLGIVQLVTESGPAEEDTVAEGTAAALGGPDAEPATFSAEDGEAFTVWLRTDGVGNSLDVDDIVAATTCDAVLADGGVERFQGNRQGNAVTVGDQSTVGRFDAADGEVEVSCR